MIISNKLKKIAKKFTQTRYRPNNFAHKRKVSNPILSFITCFALIFFSSLFQQIRDQHHILQVVTPDNEFKKTVFYLYQKIVKTLMADEQRRAQYKTKKLSFFLIKRAIEFNLQLSKGKDNHVVKIGVPQDTLKVIPWFPNIIHSVAGTAYVQLTAQRN